MLFTGLNYLAWIFPRGHSLPSNACCGAFFEGANENPRDWPGFKDPNMINKLGLSGKMNWASTRITAACCPSDASFVPVVSGGYGTWDAFSGKGQDVLNK